MQKLIKSHQSIYKILSENEILKITKGHNHVVILQKLTSNNPDVELVKVNAYTKFDKIL